jgi:hypothetical protein
MATTTTPDFLAFGGFELDAVDSETVQTWLDYTNRVLNTQYTLEQCGYVNSTTPEESEIIGDRIEEFANKLAREHWELGYFKYLTAIAEGLETCVGVMQEELDFSKETLRACIPQWLTSLFASGFIWGMDVESVFDGTFRTLTDSSPRDHLYEICNEYVDETCPCRDGHCHA